MAPTNETPKARKPRKSRLSKEILAAMGDSEKHGQTPPRPDIQKIDLNLVRLDEGRQKGRDAIVREIATKFDHGSLGIPLVVRGEDGLYRVPDGRKRIAAVLEINKSVPGFMTHMWCEVADRCDPRASLGRNRRSNPSPLEVFRDAYLSGSPEALDIMRLITPKGIRVEGVDHEATEGEGETIQVKCVGSMVWAHRRGVLEEAVDLIKDTWGLDAKVFQVKVFMPISALLSKNRGSVDRRRLVELLRQTTPADLDAQAGSTNGRLRTLNIANHIVERYNESDPEGPKIDRLKNSDID